MIGAAKSTSENTPVWGSDFQIGEAIDRFACQYDEMHMRTFDKYLMPKRLHYSDTTRIESVHNLMRIGMSTLKYMPSNCQDEGHNKVVITLKIYPKFLLLIYESRQVLIN